MPPWPLERDRKTLPRTGVACKPFPREHAEPSPWTWYKQLNISELQYPEKSPAWQWAHHLQMPRRAQGLFLARIGKVPNIFQKSWQLAGCWYSCAYVSRWQKGVRGYRETVAWHTSACRGSVSQHILSGHRSGVVAGERVICSVQRT